MRHPLRRVATQGIWYALGNALAKVSGFVLLPILTNTRFLSVASYGHWGVFEVTVQLAVAISGLSLAIGLVRFFHEPDGGAPVVAAAWWTTVALGFAGLALAALAILGLAPPSLRAPFWLLAFYGFAELLLAIPLALLRAQERAGWHTAVQTLKLVFLVTLSYVFLVTKKMELTGLVAAFAAAGTLTLLVAVLAAWRVEFLRPRVRPQTVRLLLGFSAPLVVGGLGSMLLNAGDRYVLALFRPAEDVAYYTLASKFGGVVNMFVVQPLNLAWLPLLFRLPDRQRPEVLRLLVPYLVFALCFVVVGLSVFGGPALQIMGSAAPYRRAIPLIPWVGLGFAAYGLSTVFSGVLALFHQTRILSIWLTLAAILNLALNFLLVPWFGPLAAAVNTLVGYTALLFGQYRAAQKLLPTGYPWARLLGVTVVTLAVSLAGALLPVGSFWIDLGLRGGLLCIWGGTLAVTRWVTVGEIRDAWKVLRMRNEHPDGSVS